MLGRKILRAANVRRALMILLIPILVMSFTFVSVLGRENIEANEMKAFMDGIFAAQLQSYHVPGAVVSVVKDGELFFAKGYGYADIENRIPVMADKTLFRIGSVSKLFVWTAVMQLAEQGKIDLNADINQYLTQFKIPNAFEKPITMMNLMNHNAGFEERAIGESVGSADAIKPLEKYLIDHMPARVREPGEFTAYSNYGASLAGYIVSQISGMPYEQYMKSYILEPLGMNRSTFLQPLPTEMQSDMAVGYSFQEGRYKAHEFEWKQSSPAGAMSATATDMAKFMNAMLNKGSFMENRILQEATVVKMQEESFTNDTRVNGIAHGFMTATMNGQRIISHSGDIFQFHSGLVLLPERNVGIFVAYNGADAMTAVNHTISAFLDHYYPDNSDSNNVPPNLDQDVSKYNGTYMPLRREYTTLGKLVGLMQSITIRQSEPDKIKVSLGFPTQLTGNYVQMEDGVFKSEDVSPLIYGDIVFGTDSKGNIQYQFQENNPSTAYVKLPWYAEPDFTVFILGISMAGFILVIASIPLSIWTKYRWNDEPSVMEDRAIAAARLLSILSLTFVIGFGVIFSKQETVYGLPVWSNVIFAMPYIIAFLAVGMTIFNILAWRKKYWGMAGRIYYTIITIISISFVWWLYYWNLWVFRA